MWRLFKFRFGYFVGKTRGLLCCFLLKLAQRCWVEISWEQHLSHPTPEFVGNIFRPKRGARQLSAYRNMDQPFLGPLLFTFRNTISFLSTGFTFYSVLLKWFSDLSLSPVLSPLLCIYSWLTKLKCIPLSLSPHMDHIVKVSSRLFMRHGPDIFPIIAQEFLQQKTSKAIRILFTKF